jgi:3D (Asp-Asp-Asp) domain-containing protein
VAIQRARPVTIGGPDVHLETRSRAESVGALLAEQGVPLGELDLVEPGLEAPVPAYGSVRVVRVREETEQVLIPLLFGTRQQVQAGLTPGARVRLQTGQEGVIEQTVRVRFEDGAEVSRQTLGETRREPVEEVIGIGPAVVAAVVPASAPAAPAPRQASVPAAPAPAAPPRSATAPAPSGGPEGARRSMSMVATAYDPGPASTGKSPGHPAYGITASGMRAGYGVVAVDPRVIPLGTRLYIPGYGNAIAGDTGGAIKGQRIDLGYATYNEAIRFGRQTVTVYVLD